MVAAHEPGDRPAPAALEPLRRFLDSDDRYRGVDHLDSVAAYAAYAAAHLPGWPALDAASLPRARSLRDAVRGVVLGHPGARLEDVVRVSVVVEDGAARTRVSPTGAAPYDGLAALALEAVVTASADGSLAHLGECGREDCRWVYFDDSPAGTARWCSDTCRNVMKTRAYRARRRAG
jgi:predicted RNA-binding Zn ribbon-like protein